MIRLEINGVGYELEDWSDGSKAVSLYDVEKTDYIVKLKMTAPQLETLGKALVVFARN